MRDDAGVRLRTLRLRRGMSQVALADLACISPAFVSMVENGQRTLTRVWDIVAVADVLKVSPLYLADGREDDPAPTRRAPRTVPFPARADPLMLARHQQLARQFIQLARHDGRAAGDWLRRLAREPTVNALARPPAPARPLTAPTPPRGRIPLPITVTKRAIHDWHTQPRTLTGALVYRPGRGTAAAVTPSARPVSGRTGRESRHRPIDPGPAGRLLSAALPQPHPHPDPGPPRRRARPAPRRPHSQPATTARCVTPAHPRPERGEPSDQGTGDQRAVSAGSAETASAARRGTVKRFPPPYLPDEVIAGIRLAAMLSAPFWARRHARDALGKWRVPGETIDNGRAFSVRTGHECGQTRQAGPRTAW